MNILQNIDHLNTLFLTEEQKEFLATIRTQADFLKSKNDSLKTLNRKQGDRVDELEDFIENMDNDYSDEIDAGIGTIEYNTSNIDLSGIMEALSERLITTSPYDIIKLLESK